MVSALPLFAVFSLVSAAAAARTEERAVPRFDALEVASGIRVTAEIGQQRPVRIEAGDEVLPLLDIRVVDGALRIGFKPDTRYHGGGSVDVFVQTPELRAVAASGGAIVRATFTRDREHAVQASGGAELHIKGVDAGRLSVQGSGGAVIELEGSADNLDLQMSGGTQLHGSKLSLKDVAVQASGGSQAEIRAEGRIRGSLSGGSELHVRGGAKAQVAASGGSSVEVEE
ncbi:MAG TPA: head GIN domain-containing protein [Myxococcales bacterium]|nr:head GIN domain-containing protein [Myxococcales bacterium]